MQTFHIAAHSILPLNQTRGRETTIIHRRGYPSEENQIVITESAIRERYTADQGGTWTITEAALPEGHTVAEWAASRDDELQAKGWHLTRTIDTRDILAASAANRRAHTGGYDSGSNGGAVK